MLAQVFNPTEIKKNGPATRPAHTPARRNGFAFTAASVVLPTTSQNYGDARDSVNAPWWQWFKARSRASEHSPASGLSRMFGPRSRSPRAQSTAAWGAV